LSDQLVLDVTLSHFAMWCYA